MLFSSFHDNAIHRIFAHIHMQGYPFLETNRSLLQDFDHKKIFACLNEFLKKEGKCYCFPSFVGLIWNISWNLLMIKLPTAGTRPYICPCRWHHQIKHTGACDGEALGDAEGSSTRTCRQNRAGNTRQAYGMADYCRTCRWIGAGTCLQMENSLDWVKAHH